MKEDINVVDFVYGVFLAVVSMFLILFSINYWILIINEDPNIYKLAFYAGVMFVVLNEYLKILNYGISVIEDGIKKSKGKVKR